MSEDNSKLADLKKFSVDDNENFLTTNQGAKVADDLNSLRAGVRGPTLLEDFILREKITHFDHERIPERVVHARGSAAHGYFQVYESMANYTKAKFLQNPNVKTPVFVRFSTVAGSRGSTDTPRDVRGFAVKFYTEDGVYDLVGNNIPIFFIQDAIKFPDLIHAVKPEPHNEMPQAASAHDTFWDFISLTPEAMHMVMWVMSDRALPRSFSMMEGFGIHTFRFINDKGQSHFVKFHWKPVLGVHSLLWDESQAISGKDSDFHRRDLWETLNEGGVMEWEFGVQLVPEQDENKFDFDLLDPTKIIPEEIVPVKIIGKLTLNTNPENFFAETEQVAFHPGHIVPGIDFTNDPLLQGRLFSYTDTQLSRLGGPNFHELPINRPTCPFHNNQRDGMHRQTINIGRTSYHPNSLANGYPVEASEKEHGFVSFAEKLEGHKIRARSPSFADHFSQATLFWNSQSDIEKDHLASALQFELSKVETKSIRERMLQLLANIDMELTARVAKVLGMPTPSPTVTKTQPIIAKSAALSMANTRKDTINTRKIAVIALDGVKKNPLEAMKKALLNAGAKVKILSPHLGELTTAEGGSIPIDHTIVTMPSVLFDGIYIPDTQEKIPLIHDIVQFIWQAYHHGKTIAASGAGVELLREIGIFQKNQSIPGLIIDESADINQAAEQFKRALAQHRHWSRK